MTNPDLPPDPADAPVVGRGIRRLLRAAVRPIRRYARWLHTGWPAGRTERLPVVRADGSTRVPGLWVVGDLGGVPLLKLSANAGTRVVRRIAAELEGAPRAEGVLDVAIIGGGVSGFAAALEAERCGLEALVLEAAEPFATIVNFPRGKPIFTYPSGTALAGELRFHDKSAVKEGLLEDLREQTVERGLPWVRGRVSHVARSGDAFEVHCPDGIEAPADAVSAAARAAAGRNRLRARRVVVAIGRTGDYRRLDVPGEDRPTVSNRLHDPEDFRGRRVLVVGGGDSAVEAAVALVDAGADVTLSHRGPALVRPKPANVARLDARSGERLRIAPSTTVAAIGDRGVDLDHGDGSRETIPADAVFAMIGRRAPLEFFRRSGVPIRGERTAGSWAGLAAFLAFCVWLYHWKKTGVTIADVPLLRSIGQIGDAWAARGWFPYDVPGAWASLGGAFADRTHLLGTLRVSLGEPGFWYSLAYCLCVVAFGIDRVRRRRTPYVAWQTLTLAAIQCIPLFVLPYLVLPWMGNNGWFDHGAGKAVADALFPLVDYGHGREYWRAFGLILAWPLFLWNVFTSEPLTAWLVISVLQTFVIIPLLVRRWGKGAYCGWICSCGALAETLGDRHREKMPHGPFWNAFNMVGQAFLAFAFVLLGLRVAGWVLGPGSWPSRGFTYLFHDLPVFNYVWFVDLLWAGILGVGLYFWFSGRVWCRFACPLAALMHVYARWSRFRILSDKEKCISCNVCTSVCHQGIDVMSFANKGLPMADPECVRCSACVEGCPTGVLAFGRVDARGRPALEDPPWLAASPVRIAEGRLPDR